MSSKLDKFSKYLAGLQPVHAMNIARESWKERRV